MNLIAHPVTGIKAYIHREGRPSAPTGAHVGLTVPNGATHAVFTVKTPVYDGALSFRIYSNQRVKIVPAVAGSVQIPLSFWTDSVAFPMAFEIKVHAGGMTSSRGLVLAVSEDAPAVSAPEVTTAPAVTLARVGSPVQWTAGVYTNMDLLVPTYEILVAGSVVATNAAYTPVPSDDGKAITVRETATNGAGAVQSTSSGATCVFPAPAPNYAQPDVSTTEGGQEFQANTADWFYLFNPETDDLSLYQGRMTYSVTGTDASIDATTGLLTVGTATVRADDTVTVRLTTSGGYAEIAFDMTVTEAVDLLDFPAPVADSLWSIVEARTLSPVGRRTWSVDGSVTVPEGFELVAYSGREQNGGPQDAASVVTPGTPGTTAGGYAAGTLLYNLLAWRREADGAWGGLTTQRQFTVQGAYPAPTVIAPLPDITLTQDDPDPVLDGAAVFYATSDYQGSTFSVTGSGASINSSTGALTIDTASTLTNEAIEVTATNAAGSDSDTFLLTVTAAPGSEPFPATIAANQWTTNEERDLAPEGRSYLLINSSVAETYDPAKFELLWAPTAFAYPPGKPEWGVAQTPGVAYRTNSESPVGTVIYSTLFWRRIVGGETQLAAAVKSWTVQGLNVQPPSGQLPVLSDATMNKVLASGKYSTKATAGRSVSRTPASHGPTPIMLALRVMAGGASSTVKTRLTDQIAWSLIGDKCIIANSGYGGQYDQHHVGMFALCKNIPEVWNGLTSTQKNKIDVLMKAHVVAQAWACSDKNAGWPGQNLSHYDIRGGDKYKRTWAPNFRVPMIGGLLTAIPYFGTAEAIQSYLDGITTSEISSLKTAFTNYGLSNPKGIWDRMGSASNAPTHAELVNAVKGFRYYGKALTTANTMSFIRGESDILWNRTFSPGYSNGNTFEPNHGLQVGGGWYGVYYDGTICGIILNRSNLPAWYGQTGMANELDTTDGGDPCNGNNKAARSAMSYAVDGARAELMMLSVLGATGYISPEFTGMDTVMGRVFAGWRDFQDKTDRGFKSTSKGQCAAGGRETWDGSFPEGTYLFSVGKDLADFCVAWLG